MGFWTISGRAAYMGFLAFRALQLIWASWPSVRCSFIWAFWAFMALLLWASWPFGRAAMAFNYPIHPPVWLKLPSTPFCMVEIIQHALLYGWNYPARPSVWLKLSSTPFCTVEIIQYTLLYDWNYPARPLVRLSLPNTPSCMVEIILHALKGQKLLTQGNALGINDIQLTPCKGKSFTYRRGFSFFY